MQTGPALVPRSPSFGWRVFAGDCHFSPPSRKCHKNSEIGHCNDLDQEMKKCLNSENTEKRTQNREYKNACQKNPIFLSRESEK
uniref:Uncharacterized protein n=1 Tax=Suricata suricatta TaxID=37032 RepID=A0A673T481_SURSU